MNPATLTTCSERFDVALADGAHARMRDALGWRVTAAGGALWITQDGDLRDVVLEAGESFAFDRPAALVSALGAARAQFAPPVRNPSHHAKPRMGCLQASAT